MAEKITVDLCPPVPVALLEFLERRYPERTPDISWSLDKIRHAGGERSVVRMLRQEFASQNTTVLKPSS